MAHTVKIEVFEGPIELLLHLIGRRRVDIYDVSIATITEEFLAALDDVEGLDLETATSFLIVAATLLELKSARLLPGPDAEGLDGRLLEERDLLLGKLVEIATFREAGAWLAAGLAEGARLHPREAGLEPRYAGLAPDPLEHLQLDRLARAAAEALAPRPVPVLDVSHVSPITETVKDAVADIAPLLESRGRATLTELCGPQPTKMQIVVRFLALLELYKAGAVDLGQAATFGAIEAVWTGELSGTEALVEADEYSFEGGGG